MRKTTRRHWRESSFGIGIFVFGHPVSLPEMVWVTLFFRLLSRVTWDYRLERWWKLLTSILNTSLKYVRCAARMIRANLVSLEFCFLLPFLARLRSMQIFFFFLLWDRCAYLTANVQEYVTIALELIGKRKKALVMLFRKFWKQKKILQFCQNRKHFTLVDVENSPDDKTRVQRNLIKIMMVSFLAFLFLFVNKKCVCHKSKKCHHRSEFWVKIACSLFQNETPDPEPGCDSACVEQARKLWESETDQNVFTVEMHNIIPFGENSFVLVLAKWKFLGRAA